MTHDTLVQCLSLSQQRDVSCAMSPPAKLTKIIVQRSVKTPYKQEERPLLPAPWTGQP